MTVKVMFKTFAKHISNVLFQYMKYLYVTKVFVNNIQIISQSLSRLIFDLTISLIKNRL